MTRILQALSKAMFRFLYNHGVALASNVAFSLLLALFPFLLLVTASTVSLGGEPLRDAMTQGLFTVFPYAIARILEPEMHAVVDQSATSLLGFGASILLLTLTGAIESLREGLNRAYGQRDRRSFLSRRLSGLLFLFGSGVVLASVALILVAAPIAWAFAVPYMPWLADFSISFELARFGLAGLILFVFLIACHMKLPARPLSFRGVMPGIGLTLCLWILSGSAYSFYLSNFATYARVYAGLAGGVATMIFLHIISSILLIGAEFNAALARYDKAGDMKKADQETLTGSRILTSA